MHSVSGIEVVFHDFQVKIGWTQQLFVRLPIFASKLRQIKWMLQTILVPI